MGHLISSNFFPLHVWFRQQNITTLRCLWKQNFLLYLKRQQSPRFVLISLTGEDEGEGGLDNQEFS